MVKEIEKEGEYLIPDEREIVSLARRDMSVDAENYRKLVVQHAHLLPEATAKEFSALVLNAPYGTAKYRIGLLKPLSLDDKRRFSRLLGIYSTSANAIKYQILDGMLFEILMTEAYGKHNVTKQRQRQEQEQTRETRVWGGAEAADGDDDQTGTALTIEDLAGKRIDISNLATYYETKKKLDEGVLSENSLDTSAFVQYLLQDFILSGASDLHLHSRRGGGRIRYRFEGRVYTRFDSIPRERFSHIVNALCILGGKDPAKMRQDVVETVIKLKITIDGEVKPVEFRFESLPTLHSPSVSLRGQSKPLRDITKIGFNDVQLEDISNVISNDRGIVVVTGPTGSGKTNTLNCIFAILEEDDDLVILEIGSPIEIESLRRVQIQVVETPSEKLTDIIYQKHFKAAMRFDPDVIGFTEIRNADETRIAFRAAVTGHLVFTTLHAADVEETFGRLFEMNIDRSIIAKGILAVVAQTLIRKLCELCKTEDPEATALAGGITIYRANEIGCSDCDGGYKGRTVVAEVLRFDQNVQRMINEGYKPSEIAQSAVDKGLMVPMKQIALEKLHSGITSEAEVVNLIELKTTINSDVGEMPDAGDYEIDEKERLPVKDADYIDVVAI